MYNCSSSHRLVSWLPTEIESTLRPYSELHVLGLRILVGCFNLKISEMRPIETAPDSLKTDVTEKLISQELKHMSPSCKRHWKIYLIPLQHNHISFCQL